MGKLNYKANGEKWRGMEQREQKMVGESIGAAPSACVAVEKWKGSGSLNLLA